MFWRLARRKTVCGREEKSPGSGVPATGAGHRAGARQKKYGKGNITVVSAGTGDIPVAEEAVVTAELMGNEVHHLYDVGVAGVHRLLANREV